MKLYKILNKFPYFLQELPYTIALHSCSTLIKSKQVSIWARNSYIFKNLVAAKSDLDLTIIVKRIGQERVIIQKYNFLKKIFPFLGEINLYLKDEIENYISLANHYEISRDPKLKSYTKKNDRESDIEKIVFLCKLIESDQENLKNIPRYRHKKWNHHLNSLKLKSDISLVGLTDLLQELLKKNNIQFSEEFVECYYKENRNDKNSCDNFYRECPCIRSYILLYPFRWIGSSLTCESFDHDIELLKDFSKEELKLLEGQISWEIWGLFSQYLHNLQRATLHTHLENIKQVMDSNEYLRSTNAYIKLNELRSLHENWLIHDLESDMP